MRNVLSNPRSGYFALFLISLLIPLFHWRVLAPALEQTRIMGGLMPGNYLLLRWLGELSRFGPVAFLALFLLSWRFPALDKHEGVAATAILFSVCLTLYALYGLMQLVMKLGGW